MQLFDVETAARKFASRLRRNAKISKAEWPVISVMRPFFYVLRFFGLAPFQISDSQLKPWSYGLAYSIFCSILQTYILYSVLHRFMVTQRRQAVLDFTETAKVSFNYSVAILNIVQSLWTREDLSGVLNIMRKFDARIVDLGNPQKETGARIFSWSMTIFSFSLWVAVNLTGMIAFDESWTTNVAYMINYVATSLSVIKFSGIVLLLGQRFKNLNQLALSSKKIAASPPPPSPPPAAATIGVKHNKQNHVDLKVIHQLHNSLMLAGESLSSQYSWPLLLWLSNLCCHSVSNLYFLINWLMSTPVWVESRLTLVNCITFWLLTFVAQLLLLHISCHFASNEANSMGSILVNWKSKNLPRNYQRVETSLHLINRRLNFTAAGCFYVNLPLLRTITGLLTTYLVLLLQFQT